MSTPYITARETDVMRLVVIGDSNKVIGRKLGVTESAVRSLLHLMYARCGFRNRAHAAVWFSTRGTVAPPPRIPELQEAT